MIKKEEVKSRLLSPIEYDIIYEGDYLPFNEKGGLMYNIYDSKESFKSAFYKCNKGKTSINAIFYLVWESDFIHFNEDIFGDFIYIKEPLH